MNFLNLGFPEILFILLLAVIIFGPNNLVKSARETGAFIKKAANSPYWKEIWATKKDLDELPKILSREAQLDDTIRELNLESKKTGKHATSMVRELINEVSNTAPPSEAAQEDHGKILPDRYVQGQDDNTVENKSDLPK